MRQQVGLAADVRTACCPPCSLAPLPPKAHAANARQEAKKEENGQKNTQVQQDFLLSLPIRMDLPRLARILHADSSRSNRAAELQQRLDGHMASNAHHTMDEIGKTAHASVRI